MLRYLTATTLLLTGLTLPAHASEKLISHTYPVADLVIPISDHPAADVIQWGIHTPAIPADTQTTEARLLRLITRQIRPQSWQERGGPGTVQYFPLGMSLVVKQTPSVHKEIAALFAALRRQQDVEVSVEVRFVEVQESVFERWSRELDRDRARPQELVSTGCNGAARWETIARWEMSRSLLVNDREFLRLLKTAQGNCKTSVIQMPKLTMFNGQIACMRVSEESGEDVMVELQPSVASDRGSVALHVNARFKGAVLDTTVNLAGGSALLGNWKTVAGEARCATKAQGTKRTGQVLLLVTPRLIISGAEEEFISQQIVNPIGERWGAIFWTDQPSHLTPVRVHGGVGP
jgi:hypothetical protein